MAAQSGGGGTLREGMRERKRRGGRVQERERREREGGKEGEHMHKRVLGGQQMPPKIDPDTGSPVNVLEQLQMKHLDSLANTRGLLAGIWQARCSQLASCSRPREQMVK